MERRIELEGCFNFRDLGGYPTTDGRRIRWRRLYRSDALHHLTLRDVERVVDELGVRRIVDLRSTHEVRVEGRGLLEKRDRAAFHHLPLFDDDPAAGREQADVRTLADRYFLMAEHAKDPIARVVTALAESEGAAVFHCAAGKDRTGVISAVILGMLDVRDEIIIADYAASQEKIDAIVERLLSSEAYEHMLEALPADTLHAAPETMVSLLDQVRECYGSMRGYARSIGVSDASLERLEAGLLEPA